MIMLFLCDKQVRSRTLLAAQEVIEEQQPVPASQHTPERVTTQVCYYNQFTYLYVISAICMLIHI